MSASSPTDRAHRRIALVAALADPARRRAAALALAAQLGAEDALLFVRDPEVGVLLPIHGLPQTLPRGWRDFLDAAGRRPRHAGRVLAPETRVEVAAQAIATEDGSAALVLLGGSPDPDAVAEVALLLPLLARAFADEQAVQVARAQATVARQAAAEARGLAEALDAARRALHHEVRTREEFLAVAAHDLKNPLGVIKGVAQLLRRRLGRPAGLPPERLRAGLESIEGEVDQMVGQVDELLDTARLQMGQPLELQRAPVDLVTLARRVVSDYQRGTERHRLRLETTQAALVGEWDARRLARVMANLVGNAVKYSPSGGEVVVEIAREAGDGGSWAVLRVRDQGIGIPEADLPRVFERFHRAENVIGRISGAGIGLAACRQLVELHAGSIAVASAEGTGSTFTVRLPLLVDSPGPIGSPPAGGA